MNSGRHSQRVRIALASIAGAAAFLIPGSAIAHEGHERIVGSGVVGGEQVEVATHGDPTPDASPELGFSPRFAGIPATWCGTPRTSDDQVNETGSLDDAKIHLVYAYPSDQPNLFSTYADMIQGDVNAIADKVAAQPGSGKSIRFDLGTSGGVGCVDITAFPLPNTTAYYNGGGTFTKLITDVSPAFGFGWPVGPTPPPHPRNLLIYSDRINPGGGISGQGHRFTSDAPTGGPHDQGGLIAVSYYNANRWAADADPTEIAIRRDVSLHEVGHNLGAVQGGPGQDQTPNGSGAAHCYDEWDVMCYADGGPYIPGTGLEYDCGTFEAPIPSLFDCNQDDYFRTSAPPPGTYLADHWNTYNSTFLCPVTPSTGCVPTNLAVPPSGGGSPAGTLPGALGGTPSEEARKKKCGKRNRASGQKRKRCKRRR